MMVFGELPNISESSKFIGVSPVVPEVNLKVWSPVTSPTLYMGERSRAEIRSKRSKSFSPMTKPIRSWDSLPINSFLERVGSPTGNLSVSMVPPVSSTNSDRQFKCPPAP